MVVVPHPVPTVTPTLAAAPAVTTVPVMPLTAPVFVPTPGPGASAEAWKAKFATLKIAFVDDELSNCRLGLRMLARLGVPASNITVLSDGTRVDMDDRRMCVVCLLCLVCCVCGVCWVREAVLGLGWRRDVVLFLTRSM